VEASAKQNEDDMTATLDDAAHHTASINPLRHTRRLSDKLLIAFHHACDTADLEIAEHLLRAIETILTRPTTHTGNNRRRNIEGLVAAHERLWHLRHPVIDQ